MSAAAYASLSDAEAIARYRAGDTQALEPVIERHETAVYRVLCRRCRNPEVARDLTQDMWSDFLGCAERVDLTRDIEPLLVTIALNRFRKRCRRDKRENLSSIPDEESAPADFFSTTGPGREHVLADMMAAVATLPPEQQEVVRYCAINGERVADYARRTGLNQRTVSTRLNRGLAAVRLRVEGIVNQYHTAIFGEVEPVPRGFYS